MSSRDVLDPALLLPVPFLALLFFLYTFFHTSTQIKRALYLLLAILTAVASATALGVACGAPLRIVAKVFTVLFHTTLSSISIYALSPSFAPPAFPPHFLQFFLSLAALLIACELISALIPTSPLLLPSTLGLVSRAILLTTAVVNAFLSRRRRAFGLSDSNIEKGPPADDSPSKALARVPSPTQATWPFPGSLAVQDQWDPSLAPDLLSPSAVTDNPDVTQDAHTILLQNRILLPLIIVIAQVFATLAAALSFTASVLVGANQSLAHILLASSLCTLFWSLSVLATVHFLPTHPNPYSSEEPVAMGYEHAPFRRSSHGHTLPQTRDPVLSPRESDSLLDFLSLRDPFASSPPPPPPLPPVGLCLDELDVGCNGNKEIGVQYRFPAPRSIVKGGRRKGKKMRSCARKGLAHQDSSRTLLPVPETRGADTDAERDRGFGDEARLAQLLLQSLTDGREDTPTPHATAPVSAVQPPQAVHVPVPQCSRWSASTTVQSTVSGSMSNRSGMSTYTTCASERVPPSRISLNTIASVLGSRKSSEARRKSALTASSSKG